MSREAIRFVTRVYLDSFLPENGDSILERGNPRVAETIRAVEEVGMKLSRRQFFDGLIGTVAVALLPRIAAAQSYPSRPIRLVVPFPPGGAFDAVGRPLAERLKSSLGTLVIENIGGGGSSLGAAAVARARPDGYTILLGGTQTHVNEALLKSKPLYDPVKDLDPIAGVAANVLCIAVHPTVPAQTLKELIGYAKANPGKLSYGHSGAGSIQHLAGELFKSLAGTPDIVHVPYRGTGPVIADVVSGLVDARMLDKADLARIGEKIALSRRGSGK